MLRLGQHFPSEPVRCRWPNPDRLQGISELHPNPVFASLVTGGLKARGLNAFRRSWSIIGGIV